MSLLLVVVVFAWTWLLVLIFVLVFGDWLLCGWKIWIFAWRLGCWRRSCWRFIVIVVFVIIIIFVIIVVIFIHMVHGRSRRSQCFSNRFLWLLLFFFLLVLNI